MYDPYENALEIVTDLLAPEFPEAAAFFKSPEGNKAHSAELPADKLFGNSYDDDAYHAAVRVFWRAQSDFQEAGDFLNSRNARNAFYGRVEEEIKKANLEVERVEREAAERGTRVKEMLDRLTRDGILTNEEREELDRWGNDDSPW